MYDGFHKVDCYWRRDVDAIIYEGIQATQAGLYPLFAQHSAVKANRIQRALKDLKDMEGTHIISRGYLFASFADFV